MKLEGSSFPRLQSLWCISTNSEKPQIEHCGCNLRYSLSALSFLRLLQSTKSSVFSQARNLSRQTLHCAYFPNTGRPQAHLPSDLYFTRFNACDCLALSKQSRHNLRFSGTNLVLLQHLVHIFSTIAYIILYRNYTVNNYSYTLVCMWSIH